MAYKLDLYDRRLLFELDKNSVIGLVQLAAELRRSKQFVLYRMRKLEGEGVITGYDAVVDMSKLGYFTFRAYFMFQQMTDEDGRQFVDYVKNLPQVWAVVAMHGKWDCSLTIGVQAAAEFHEVWQHIMLVYKTSIKLYDVSVYGPIYNFNRKFVLEAKDSVNKDSVAIDSVERVYGLGQLVRADETDKRILEQYVKNVRQSFLEISRKLKISSDTVRSRIRNLENLGVIVGYRLGLDVQKLGFISYKIDIQLVSTKRSMELFNYCKFHKNIYQVNYAVGGADFEVEVVVEDLIQLKRLIDEIKTKFKDVVESTDYFEFSKYYSHKYVPD